MNTSGIWSEKLRLSGKPCIRGQRFSMAQLLADGRPLKEIAEDFDIDYNKDQADAIKKGQPEVEIIYKETEVLCQF